MLFHPSDFLAFAGLFIIVIAETGRIPVDNPATHLELTMIHEAMVLEYAGPDLALVEWASAVKELLYLTLLVDLFMPVGMATSAAPVALGVALVAWAAKVFLLAVGVTIVGEHEREAPPVPRAGTRRRSRWAWRSWPWRSVSCEVPRMTTSDLLILCAAGMLVSVYLMVGQKALVTAIRLYGMQSLLLGVVAATIAISESPPRTLRHRRDHRGAEGDPDPVVPDADRSIASASTGRSSRSSTSRRHSWCASA